MGGYHAVEAAYDIQWKRGGRDKAAGTGSYGEVRPCTNLATHELRAVKSIEKTSWGTRGQVMAEIGILRAVSGKHPNIIQYVECYEEWGVLNLIFEYCPKGTLEEAIQRRLRSSESVAAPLLQQVVSALAFLNQHSPPILHRDVKPSNLVFADETTLKLCDFGTACFFSSPLTVAEGTPVFFPPEVHQLPRGKGYSMPMDMWAAGIIFYMLLFKGLHPFSDGGVINKPKLRGGDADVGWITSSKGSDLLEWMLMPNPDQRITPEDALHHPWFASHGLGPGTFTRAKPRKLILDSHGNWLHAWSA